MTEYLQLCKDVSDEVGLHGQISSVTPTQPLQIDTVNAVKNTWLEMQGHRIYLEFMKRTVKFTTTANTWIYPLLTLVPSTPSSSVGKILAIYNGNDILAKAPTWSTDINGLDGTVGKQPTWWRELQNYQLNSLDTNIEFNMLDSSVYTLDIIYRIAPQVLTLGTDMPMCVAEHHLAIYHGACVKMAVKLEKQSLIDEHSPIFDKLMGNIYRDHNPKRKRSQRRFI